MNLKQTLKKARQKKRAIGQFNFSSFEQLQGILKAAQENDQPIIIGTSSGESHFLGLEQARALVDAGSKKYGVDAFLNLDHGKELDWVKKAVDAGYDAVHFDGTDLNFEENIERTKEVVEYAHSSDVLVEGELGYLTGKSASHKGKIEIKKENLTSPDQVRKFVEATGVDSLAVVIGNVHGVYAEMPKLDLQRLSDIEEQSSAFLVLHGGSGIPDKDIKRAIKKGIVKINVNTELRLAWKESLTKALKKDSIKPYNLLPEVEQAVREKVNHKINLFNHE
ncbi:MAG: class II fructose-bisphosphate aldolase [Candidatus Paceibacterota bacterium]